MNKRKKIFIIRLAAAIVTISSILIFAPWEAAIYYLKPLPSSIQEQVDDSTRQGLDGIIVYVQKGEQKAEFFTSGWHNRDEKIRAKPTAYFKIGSVRKLYVASAVAKLVSRGRLSLDATLAEYLPALVGRIEFSEKITLRMLVQHRSGIPNYTDHNDFNWAEPPADPLALVLDTPADFNPDSDYSYSNTNYLLLGMIMTKTLGYDHTQFIRDELLTPLNLSQTFFSINDINLNDLMSGYYVGYDNDFKEVDLGYVATAEDVGIFLRALNDGTLFTEEEQEIYSSIYEYGHKGWVLGYVTTARYYKDIDTILVQFVNTNGDDTELLTSITYDRIVEILRNRENPI